MPSPIRTGSGDVVEQPSTRRSKPTLSDLGPLASAGERAFEAPPQPKKWQAPRNPFLASQLREIPRSHDLLARVNEPISAARQALEAEVDALQVVSDALDDLPAEQRRERDEIDGKVRAALDAGKPAPTVKPTDWEARRASLEAEERTRAERARALHREYAAVVERERPLARAALAATLEPQRKATLEALEAFAPVARGYLATVAALDEIAAVMDPEDVSHITTPEAQRVRAGGRGALGSLVAMLTSDDPVVSGRRHEPGPLRVPLHTRRAWADGSAAEFAALAQVEASDQPPYSVTDFTRSQYEHHYFPATAG
jgi:hypothetical protein